MGMLSPAAAQIAGDKTTPQWNMGCEFSKTVVGKPAKPFDSVDEKYFVLCKPVQREFAANGIQCGSFLGMENEPHTCLRMSLLNLFNKRG